MHARIKHIGYTVMTTTITADLLNFYVSKSVGNVCRPKSVKSNTRICLNLLHTAFNNTVYFSDFKNSGVARAFPGGRLAHPESQNDEENEKSLRKNKKK